MKFLASFLSCVAIAACFLAQAAKARAQDAPHTDQPEIKVILTELSPPIYPPLARQEQKPKADPTSPSNTRQSITVSELPTVTVYTDWWFRLYVIFTGLLVAVGGAGVAYAVKTLNAIKRQAKANEDQLTEIRESAEKTDRMILIAAQEAENGKAATEAAKRSAESAFLNAQAIINSERPWLFIKIECTRTRYDGTGQLIDNLGYSVSFHNYGKTPAEIVGLEQHPECRDSTDDLPMPPTYRDDGVVLAHTRMVPADEGWHDPGESFFQPQTFLVGNDWEDIRHSRKRFLYWGKLRYRDLIEHPQTIHNLEKVGTIHETCFCYFWSPRLNEFLICGPFGYNKHT